MTFKKGGPMRSIYISVVLSFAFLASCAGNSFEDLSASGTGGAAPSIGTDANAGGTSPVSEASVANDVVSPGDSSDLEDRDAATSVPDAAEASVATPDDAPVDARFDHVNDAVSIVDVKTDVLVFVDAGVDVKPSNDASDAIAEVAPKPDCLTTGVRVRWVTDANRTIVQANGSVGDPNDFTPKACTAAQDRDPLPNVFECCMSTAPVATGVLIDVDFVDSDQQHACTQYNCGNPASFNVWVNGVSCSIGLAYLPGCNFTGCPHVIQCIAP
jgi:hypothetical protein